ncbi:MAG: bifunctional transaldolase/phosoglucose isomerase [Dehalococcoidia bacterium]|nr:bifunctional transaldolase/phosoglucose isomerase [Dehalococcoidia bacterium]
MKENPLLRIRSLGQSIWLDSLRRRLLTPGELDRSIREDGLRGVFLDISWLEKALTGTHEYNAVLNRMSRGQSQAGLYRSLIVEDARLAADLLRPVHDRTLGRDGFVTVPLKVNTEADLKTWVEDAADLWQAIERSNVLLGIPGTEDARLLLRQLIAEGMNAGVILIFSLDHYREVAEAYIDGMEDRESQGKPLDRIASIAAFSISPIDMLVDFSLEGMMNQAEDAVSEAARAMRGLTGISVAHAAYRIYRDVFRGERFRRLANKGARSQRLVWTDIAAGRPGYPDLFYMEELVAPETVSALNLELLNAYRERGSPEPRLEAFGDDARLVLDRLPLTGNELGEVTARLEEEGLRRLAVNQERLHASLKSATEGRTRPFVDRQSFMLGDYEGAVGRRAEKMERADFSERFWRKDSTLWRNGGFRAAIRNGMGWLHVPEKTAGYTDRLFDFLDEMHHEGYDQLIHMGIGGSSLAPLVFQRVFPAAAKALEPNILDTNDPAAILETERNVRVNKALFILASKSGHTAEPLALDAYFFGRMHSVKGEAAADHFAVITDPDGPLEQVARERSYRRVFYGFPDVGGRYSVFSNFGLVPAALMGLNISGLIDRALAMMYACSPGTPLHENPGLLLGTALGELALAGRDKVTLVMPRSIAAFGLWLEQLLAESSGKDGVGLLPVAGESLGDPSVYGNDRVFVHFRDGKDTAAESSVEALRRVGHPVISLEIEGPIDLGHEFYRWELATAVACSILDVNPFDQPDVQLSKEYTNRLLADLRRGIQIFQENPSNVEAPLRFYGDVPALGSRSLLRDFFGKSRKGDYIAIQAFVTETAGTDQALDRLRLRLRDSLGVATTVGYGPRFLHSTGQFHKGGPNTGLFLQLTADDIEDMALPGVSYTFGEFRRAQAMGDLEALRARGRRVLRIHLGEDVGAGLTALEQLMEPVLARSL